MLKSNPYFRSDSIIFPFVLSKKAYQSEDQTKDELPKVMTIDYF
jgi:hypothetical protein